MVIAFKSRNGFYDSDLGYYEDTGCEYSAKCVSVCPFKDCIISLPYRKKMMIVNGKTIKEVYRYYDMGLGTNLLSKMYNSKIDTIQHWVRNRSNILNTLERYI
jgi:hypothetical protein